MENKGTEMVEKFSKVDDFLSVIVILVIATNTKV